MSIGSAREKKVKLLELQIERNNIANQIDDLEDQLFISTSSRFKTVIQSEIIELRVRLRSLDFEIERLKGELKDLFKEK